MSQSFLDSVALVAVFFVCDCTYTQVIVEAGDMQQIMVTLLAYRQSRNPQYKASCKKEKMKEIKLKKL